MTLGAIVGRVFVVALLIGCVWSFGRMLGDGYWILFVAFLVGLVVHEAWQRRRR